MPLSPRQAAARLGLSPTRVRALIAAGALRATNIGLDRPLWAIEEAELARFAALERPNHRPRKEPIMTTETYPITTEEAKTEINRHYNNGTAWDRGIRTWHSGGPDPIAVTFIESPRTPGAFRSVPYGTDESYRLT